DEVMRLLPPELHGVRCHWRATTKTGHVPGIFLRLFFWLDRGVSDAEKKTWMLPYTGNGIDPCISRTGQPVYVAAPAFEEGVKDPLAQYGLPRSGMVAGFRDVVAVPEIVVPEQAHREAPEGLTEDDSDTVLQSAAKAIIGRNKVGSSDT